MYWGLFSLSDFPDTIQIPSGRQEHDPGCAC